VNEHPEPLLEEPIAPVAEALDGFGRGGCFHGAFRGAGSERREAGGGQRTRAGQDEAATVHGDSCSCCERPAFSKAWKIFQSFFQALENILNEESRKGFPFLFS
jgi:hypothetical protein